MRPLLSTNELKTNKNLRSNRRPRDSEKKRNGKSSAYVSSKKRLPTDRPKLMPSEPKEHSKRARDKPEKEKSSSKPRDSEFRLTLRRPGKSNSRKRQWPWPSRLASKERTTCTRSRNKSRSSCRRERSRRTGSRHSLTTPIRLGRRLPTTMTSRSRIDSISWRRAERSERKSTWREKRSNPFNRPKYRN